MLGRDIRDLSLVSRHQVHFAKQIHQSISRLSNSPPNSFSVSRSRLAIPAIEALTKRSSWPCSRSKMCWCIPFGLLPTRLRMPGSQPSRCRMVYARRMWCCRSRYSASFSNNNPRQICRILPPLLPKLVSLDNYADIPCVLAMAAIDPKLTLALRTRTAAIRRVADTARMVAFITEATLVPGILTHIGEPAEPPRISPARRSMPYLTGRPSCNPHPGMSSTRMRSGSRLPSPSVVGTPR